MEDNPFRDTKPGDHVTIEVAGAYISGSFIEYDETTKTLKLQTPAGVREVAL